MKFQYDVYTEGSRNVGAQASRENLTNSLDRIRIDLDKFWGPCGEGARFSLAEGLITQIIGGDYVLRFESDSEEGIRTLLGYAELKYQAEHVKRFEN